MTRLDDFRSFARAVRDPSDGPVPGIAIVNKSEREWLAIVASFDLLPFAFRADDPGAGVLVIDLARRSIRRTGDVAYLQDRYARNHLAVEASVRRRGTFAGLVRTIEANFGIPRRALDLRFAVPPIFMGYLNYKALDTCKRTGLDPAQVAEFHGRLVPRGASWRMVPVKLVTTEGETIPLGGTR